MTRRSVRPLLAIVAVALASAAVPWAWTVSRQPAPTIRRPEGQAMERTVERALRAAPATGEWTIVEQLGGPIEAFVIDGRQLLAGRGAHLEAYDLSDMDPSGRPRLLARSPLLPGRPSLIAVLEGTVYAVLEGQTGIFVFDPRAPAVETPADAAHDVSLAQWRVIHGAANIEGLAVDRGVQPKRLVARAVEDGSQGLSRLIVLEPALGRATTIETMGGPCCRPACDSLARSAASGGHVYCSDGSGIRFLDLTDLANPEVGGELSGVGYGRRVSVDDGRIFVSHIPMAIGLVEAYDIANPRAPERTGFYSGGQEHTQVLFDVVGGRMAVVVGDEGDLRLDIVDVRDMSQPRLLTSLAVGSHYPAFALGDDHLAVAIQTENGDHRFDIVDLRPFDHVASGTTSTSSRPEAAHIDAPTVEGVQAWGNGALVLSSLGVVGAQLQWPSAATGDLLDGATATGVDRVAKVFGAVGTPMSAGNETRAHDVLVQATGGGKAAALLVREGKRDTIDVGLIAWALGQTEAIAPGQIPQLGRRIAWARFGRVLGTLEDPVSRAGWNLVVDDRQAVAFNTDQPGAVRLLVFDLTEPSRPRLVSDASAELTDSDRLRHAALIQNRIIVGGGHQIVAFERQSRTKLRRVAEWTTAGPYKNMITGLTATSQGLLVVARESIEIWPLDQAGFPDPHRVTTLARIASLYPRDPDALRLSLAVDGDHAFAVGWSSNAFPSMLREIHLATGEVTALLDLPPTYREGDIGIAAAGNRLYVHHPAWGLYILERRP